MDEVTNQEQETIQSLPIQQGKPSKKKLSIWIFLSIFFLITTLILSYFLINQKQEVNDKQEAMVENFNSVTETIPSQSPVVSKVEPTNKNNKFTFKSYSKFTRSLHP